MLKRGISQRLLEALVDAPVVVLQGARQTGKSTLAQMIRSEGHPAEYLTMDSLAVLAAAQTDPHGFLVGLRGKDVILDEIQRAPELFISIKEEVDRERTPGRFLLTGSAKAMLLPRLSDSLVGRLQLLTLWPLAQCEITGAGGDLVDSAFCGEFSTRHMPCDRSDVIRRALVGGYPEMVTRSQSTPSRPGASLDRLSDWFDAYVTTLLQRDVRDLSDIQGLNTLPQLLRLIASRATAALNVADLSRSSGISNVTLHRYLTLLQAVFLIQLIQPWSSNLGSRLVKAPKVLLTDTGLLSYLNGMSEAQLLASPTFAGPLVENFVGMELLKLASWSHERPQLLYYRTHDRREVDFVLQARSGKVVGVEVKASASVAAADFKGLRSLADAAGAAFACGIVLYSGETLLPFGQNLYAVPLSALWQS